MKGPTVLTQKRLRDLLEYDPETGRMIWRVSLRGPAKLGSPAGVIDRNGYHVIRIAGVQYKAHRLAWLYVHGEWPPTLIDHSNGDKTDNRIANLRMCTSTQNQWNKKGSPSARNGGLKGASKRTNGSWRSRITVDGKSIHLGTFGTAHEAHTAYVNAAHRFFGEFARVK